MTLLGSNKKSKLLSFSDRLTGVKEVFNQAYSDADQLKKEMIEDLAQKEAQIIALSKAKAEVEETLQSTDRFMENIANLLG